MHLYLATFVESAHCSEDISSGYGLTVKSSMVHIFDLSTPLVLVPTSTVFTILDFVEAMRQAGRIFEGIGL